MKDEVQTEYLAAAADAEAALEALAAARERAQLAMNHAAKTNSPAERHVMGTNYGMDKFDQACQQSAGAKGLLPLLSGNPERSAAVGLRVGGNVVTLMEERLGVAPAEPVGTRKRAEEGHEPVKPRTPPLNPNGPGINFLRQ